MKATLLLPLILILAISCAENREPTEELAATDPECLQQDLMNWWNYHKNSITLSEDFIPLDTDAEVIDKEAFLKKLTSGNYIPIHLQPEDSLTYQLHVLGESSDEKIRGYIKTDSWGEYRNFLMEGQKIPAFEFEDLEGNIYTNTNTLGKTLVLKCWFINCKPCVAEMPELNKLVEEFKERDDVKFVSLALDPKEDLEKFLQKTEFKYAVVPEQKEFMENLGVSIFPTHILVNETGRITKVVNSSDELKNVLAGIPIPERRGNAAPPPPPPPPGPRPVSSDGDTLDVNYL